MNTQKYHFAIVVLLLGVVLLPVTTASQSADRDLGIVRLRYVTIVVRNYDEALKWYTNVLGLEKNGGRDVWLGQAVVGCCPAGPKGLAFTPASIRLRQVGEIKRFLLRDFFCNRIPVCGV